jgi:hypothetical protein
MPVTPSRGLPTRKARTLVGRFKEDSSEDEEDQEGEGSETGEKELQVEIAGESEDQFE